MLTFHSLKNTQCDQKERILAKQSHKGVALLTVLWIVAIMGVIATGLVSSVRSDVRSTSFSQDSLQATAIGQAAIYLALQQQALPVAQSAGSSQELNLQFAQTDIAARVEPSTSLLDLNRIQADALEQIFNATGANQNSAQLAQEVIAWRSEVKSGSQQRGFESVEDLLQVPGFSYELYSKIESFFTLMPGGQDQVTPGLSSPQLQQLLGMASDNNIASNRTSNAYRITVQVPFGSHIYEIVQDMVLAPPSGLNNNAGVAWRIVSTKQRALISNAGERHS